MTAFWTDVNLNLACRERRWWVPRLFGRLASPAGTSFLQQLLVRLPPAPRLEALFLRAWSNPRACSDSTGTHHHYLWLAHNSWPIRCHRLALPSSKRGS
jgi:hypothetical protein